MPTRAQACAWIAGLGLVLPSLATAQDRTGRDVVDLIVREGPQALAIRAEADVVRREQAIRLGYANPSVQYTREGAGFTEFLQIEQTFSPLGLRGLLSRAGVEAAAAADAERDARLWDLRQRAAGSVARLLAEQDRLTALEAYAAEVNRLIEVLRVREREGEGSRFDRLRAEQELRDAGLGVTSAAIAAADARGSLSALMPPTVPLGGVTANDVTSAASADLNALITRATGSRAELRALTRARSRAAIEGEAWSPSRLVVPRVFGGMKRADNDEARERGTVFGLNVTVPVFNSGAREVARWQAEGSRLDAERLALEAQIRAEVERAYRALELRRGALAANEADATTELPQIAEVAYREGEIGILELLDALRTAARARARSIDIALDARLAALALERAVGDILWP